MRAALRIKPRQHRKRRPAAWPASLIAGVATTVTALSLLGAAPAGSSMAAAGPARPGTAHQSPAQTASLSASPRDLVRATTPSDVPYALPVQLPSSISSPSVSADAPYTPAVLNLIAQLEPGHPPTEAQLANASILFHGGTNTTCNNVGPTAAPTGTSPSIMPPCWTDAQGVNTFSGPNAEMTTGPTTLMNLASSFDRQLGNVWGQTEGTEARELMVTGLFGPQTDIDRLPNWGRNLTTTGEDPYLSGQMVASQINGIQGAGALSQMKHFAVYNGQSQNTNTQISDQALHQIYLTPYEAGFVDAGASATMCSYQIWQDTSPTLPSTVSSLSSTAPLSPYATAGQNPQTWPLSESHFSCEQPLTLTYALRDLWGSVAMVGSDYPATHSTSAIFQGEDQEQPTSTGYFSDSNSLSTTSGGGFGGPPSAFDATGDTCADASGNAVSCSAPNAVHVAGVPGAGCPATGCTLAQAVANGSVPLSVFNQGLAMMLYQEQRFGMLGCDQTPVAASCTNPGGISGDRSGNALLPAGPAQGATPAANLGTKNGDAAVAELMSEQGAVLLKNDAGTLPVTRSDLSGGVMVTGPGAEYTISDPTGEASIGFADRDSISPLEQLRQFSGDPGAFSYVPANSPSGEPVPSSALSDSSTSVTGHLDRTTGPGSPSADSSLDFTTVSGHGQLAAGQLHLDRVRVRARHRHLQVPVPVLRRRPGVRRDVQPGRRGADAEHRRERVRQRRDQRARRGAARHPDRCRLHPGRPDQRGRARAEPDRRHLPPGHDHLRQRHRRPGELPLRLLAGQRRHRGRRGGREGQEAGDRVPERLRRLHHHPQPLRLQPGDDLGPRVAERGQHPAHRGGGRGEPEHGGRAQHHQPGADAVDQRRQVGAGDVVLRRGGRHLDGAAAARPGRPERPHRHHLARQRHRHPLGLQRDRAAVSRRHHRARTWNG